MRLKRLSLITGILLIPVFLSAQSNPVLEKKADSLYQHFEEQKALEIYLQILEHEPEDYQALWRASFLYSRVGHRLESNKKKEEYYNRAIELAERALEKDSTDSQSNFVMAVAMGRKAIISGAKSRVAASRDIKKYAERAISFDSANAGAWHVLGRWHFKVANLNWFERAAANMLFGGLPGDASNDQAAEYIEKAINLNQEYILYYYDLATVYDEMGQHNQAIETCEEALARPILTPGDEDIKQNCRVLIENLQ